LLVIDAAVALSWLFPRVKLEEAALADQALDAMASQPAIVPALWHAEIANGLLAAERRKVVNQAQTFDYLGRLSRLAIRTDEVSVAVRREIVMSLAREHSLNAANATYLDVALRFGATLASFDSTLVAAMRRAGGTVLESNLPHILQSPV
jgi:predicted nucleic acid-binding protein